MNSTQKDKVAWLIQQISKTIEWDITDAREAAGLLLEDVNDHEEAGRLFALAKGEQETAGVPAAQVVTVHEAPPPVSTLEALGWLSRNGFMSGQQTRVVRDAARGEEGNFFRQMVADLYKLLHTMPRVYETDGHGDEATVWLHYFKGGSDWWIKELDIGDEQHQAFGYACLNGDTMNAELGYISLLELTRAGVELDLYWKPCTIGDVKKKLHKAA